MKKDTETAAEKQIKIKPKKRLGQNFLTETTVIDKLITAAAIEPNQTILDYLWGKYLRLVKVGCCLGKNSLVGGHSFWKSYPHFTPSLHKLNSSLIK